MSISPSISANQAKPTDAPMQHHTHLVSVYITRWKTAERAVAEMPRLSLLHGNAI